MTNWAIDNFLCEKPIPVFRLLTSLFSHLKRGPNTLETWQNFKKPNTCLNLSLMIVSLRCVNSKWGTFCSCIRKQTVMRKRLILSRRNDATTRVHYAVMQKQWCRSGSKWWGYMVLKSVIEQKQSLCIHIAYRSSIVCFLTNFCTSLSNDFPRSSRLKFQPYKAHIPGKRL